MSSSLRWVGDRALLRTFHGAVADANRAAVACAREIAALGVGGIEDIVPGARSVLVVLHPGRRLSSGIREILSRDASSLEFPYQARQIEIPVRYGGDDGPDLADVAGLAGLSEGEVVSTHAAGDYVVGFIGFSPGFAYLLGLDEHIAVPRIHTPRTKVAPGSVGIGGPYTGIYPRATAGGWRLIGRTEVELFDPRRDPPALLQPGDRIRFVPR
jgi:KipI family sensor histidine kinase inhibitor